MWGIIMGQSHTTNTNMGLFNSSKDIGLNKTTILPARSSPNLLAGHEFSRHFSSGHVMMNNSTKTFPTFINRNNSYSNNDNMNNYRQKNLPTPNSSPQRQSAVTPLVCEKEHVGCKMSESRPALDYVVLSTSAPCLARQSTSLDYSRGKLEQDTFMSLSSPGQSPSLNCWGEISQVKRDSTISSRCLSPPHLKISKPILALTTWSTQAKADQSGAKELGEMAEGKVQMGTKADNFDNPPSPGSFVKLSDLDTDVIFESFRQLKVQEEILPTKNVQLEKSCENIIVQQLQNRKLPETLLESLDEDLTEQRDEEIDRNFEQICGKSRRKNEQKRQKQRGKKKSHKRRRRCRNRRNFIKMASTPAASSAVANPVHPDKDQTPQTSNNDGDITSTTLNDSKPKEISSVQVPITITSEPSLSDDDISTEKESDEERDETDYVSTNFSFDDCFECIANGMKGEEYYEGLVERDDDNNKSTNDSDSETEVITSENDNNDNVIDETELEKETERDLKGPKITRPNSDRDLGKDSDRCPEKTCDQKEDSDDEDDDGIIFDYSEVGASDEIQSGETEQDLKGAKTRAKISSGKGDRDLDEEDSDADNDGCPEKNRDQEKDSDDDDRIVFDYSEVGGSSPTPTKSRKFQCSSSKGIRVTCNLNFVDSDSDSDHDRPSPSKKHKLSRFFDESDSESDDEDGENSDSDSDEEDSDSDEEDEDQNDDGDGEEDDDDDDDFICFVRDDVPEPSPPVQKKRRSKKSRNFPGLFPSSSPPRSFFGSGRPSLTSHFHMTLSVDLELPSKTSEDIPEDVPERSPSKRKVRFAPDSELVVVRMVEWEDRKGPWEECVRDTARFKKRIRKAGRCISKVLRTRFRERIYRERFATDSEL